MNSKQRKQAFNKHVRDLPVGMQVKFSLGFTPIRGTIEQHDPKRPNVALCAFDVGGRSYKRFISYWELRPY